MEWTHNEEGLRSLAGESLAGIVTSGKFGGSVSSRSPVWSGLREAPEKRGAFDKGDRIY